MAKKTNKNVANMLALCEQKETKQQNITMAQLGMSLKKEKKKD